MARLRNFQPYDFESLPAADHALGGLGGESEAHQLRQLVGREAVRVHDCLGAAFATTASEQSKRSALIGLGATTAGREGQQVGTGLLGEAITPDPNAGFMRCPN
jgi:hypothetical protein